jgi:hypothetical protein
MLISFVDYNNPSKALFSLPQRRTVKSVTIQKVVVSLISPSAGVQRELQEYAGGRHLDLLVTSGR